MGVSCDHLPASFLALLGTWALQRTQSGGIRGIGPAPTWWTDLYGTQPAEGDLTSCLGLSEFLRAFLADATEFWRRDEPGKLASGEWQEGRCGGPSMHLEAIALCAPEGHLLFISLLGVDGHERQQIIQKAREGALRHHRDLEERRVHEGLLQRQQAELKRRVSERTAELRSANEQLRGEVSDRRLAEARLQTSLEQKQALLQEVHHRVKNNLQIIASLLDLQAGRAEGEVVRGLLAEARNRVRSMALAHESAYGADDITEVDLGRYVDLLVDAVGGSGTVTVDVAALSVDMDTVVALGLLLNELLTAALRRPVSQPEQRKIEVAIHRLEDERLELVARDSGGGLLKTGDAAVDDSLESQLVAALVRQLKGRAPAPECPGEDWTLVFPS